MNRSLRAFFGLKVSLYLLVSTPFLLAGCSGPRTFPSLAQYVAYINDPANGLVQVKETAGWRVTVKFLPPAYQAYLDASKSNSRVTDSLVNLYQSSPTFQVIVQPASKQVPLTSLLHRQAQSQADITQNINTLYYGMEPLVALTGSKPVLSTLESTVEMDQKLSFLFVFTPKGKTSIYAQQQAVFELKQNFFLPEGLAFAFASKELKNAPLLSIQ
jgi:hypothetical protein